MKHLRGGEGAFFHAYLPCLHWISESASVLDRASCAPSTESTIEFASWFGKMDFSGLWRRSVVGEAAHWYFTPSRPPQISSFFEERHYVILLEGKKKRDRDIVCTK